MSAAQIGASKVAINPEAQKDLVTALGLGVQYGVLMPFSRNQESEADILGLHYMKNAGYDPVSYTHLDVYKRQLFVDIVSAAGVLAASVIASGAFASSFFEQAERPIKLKVAIASKGKLLKFVRIKTPPKPKFFLA